MERPNAIAALKDKRGEIAGRVDALQDQLEHIGRDGAPDSD